MGSTRWERWAPASGIVYVLLFVISFIVAPGEIGDTDDEILDYYADGGNRGGEIAAYFLIVVAMLFFLWFVSTLRKRLRSVEPEPNSVSSLAFGAGVASAALMVAAVSFFVAISVTVEDNDDFVLEPNVARAFETAGYLVFVGSTMVAAVLVAATSVLAIRTAVLPKWLGWLGLLAALALLAAIVFFPIFVLWLWVLVVSIFMLLRPTAESQEGESQTFG